MALRRSGFTFVELLLAATMVSILFVGLGAHLRGGLRVWGRVTAEGDARQQQHVALERVERDLANGFAYDPKAAYDGPPPQLPSPQFEPDVIRVFTVEAGTPPRPGGVRLVSYWCEPGEDGGLWRTSQSVSEARTQREPARELLLPDCEALRVRYAYTPPDEFVALEWREEWLFARELPRLIEVTVHRTSGPDVTRVMTIPHGSLKPAQPPS